MKEDKAYTFPELCGSLFLMIIWKIGNELQFLHKSSLLFRHTLLVFQKTDEIKKNLLFLIKISIACYKDFEVHSTQKIRCNLHLPALNISPSFLATGILAQWIKTDI